MGPRSFTVCVMLLLTCLGALLYAAFSNQFGSLAKSPQLVTMSLGSRSFVAGGKARLWFASIDMGPVVEIECGGTRRSVEVKAHEPSAPCCGVQVQVKEIKDTVPPRAVFEVTWKE